MGVYDFDENNLPGLDDATFRKILNEPAAPYVPPPPPPPEESGYLGGTLKSLVRGITEIPIAAGNALEWNEEADRTGDDSKRNFVNRAGQVISDTAERVRDFIPPAESGNNRVKQSIFGGVESLPLSLAYAIPSTVGAVAAGAAATPETFGAATIPAALAGAAGGQAAVAPIMFRSTAQQTLEQLKKQLPDADPNALIDAAKKAGHKEWQGETISNIPEALIFSRIPGLKAGADTVKALLKPGVKQFAKNVAMSMPGEQAGEGYTSYGQAQAMNEVLPENLQQKPWEAVKDTVGPTAVMTLLMAGLGTGVQRYRANHVVNVLENANADPVERGEAAGTVYGLIKEANGEEAARNFLQHAYQAIGDEATTGTPPYAMNLSDPALMQPPRLPSDITEEGPLPDEQVFPNLPTPTPAFNPPAPSGPISRALSTTPEVVTPEVLNQPALPNVRQWIPPDVIDAEFTDLNAPRIEGRKQIPWEGGGEQSRIPYQAKGATSDLPQMQEQNPANQAQMPDVRDEEVTRPKGLREVIEARQREREGVIPDGQEEMRGQGEGGQVIPGHVARAVEEPREVPTSVGVATKQQTKETLNAKLSSGEVAPDSPIRLTTVEELNDILNTGKLREGRDFEGRSGISAQVVDGKKPIVAYGPNDRISAAIVFPKEAARGKGESANEVKVDANTDPKSLRFVIDGHPELLTYEQLQEAIGGKVDSQQRETAQEEIQVGKPGNDVRKQRVEEFKKKYGYAPEEKPEPKPVIVKALDRHGNTIYVDKTEYNDSTKNILRKYNAKGERLASDNGIHWSNIIFDLKSPEADNARKIKRLAKLEKDAGKRILTDDEKTEYRKLEKEVNEASSGELKRTQKTDSVTALPEEETASSSTIPPEVLAEYPDLQPGAAEETPSDAKKDIPAHVSLPAGWKMEVGKTRTKEGHTFEAWVDWQGKRLVFSEQKHMDNPEIVNHEIAHVVIETLPEAKRDALFDEYIKVAGLDEWTVKNNFHYEKIAMDYGDYLTNPDSTPKELKAVFDKHLGEGVSDEKKETISPETRRKNLEKRLAIAKNGRERESIRAKLEKLKKESHKNIEEIVAANDAADLMREEKKQVERAKKVGEWRSKYMDRIEMTAAGDIVRHDHEKLNELVESNKISAGRAHQMIDDAVASGVVDSKVGEYMKSRVKVEEKAEPAPQHQAKKSPEPQNAIFTEDAYQKARARMKAKLSQLNAGFDPELLQDGITIAGYHLERGARKFADYTKAMVDEFGDAIRPYLKAFYNGVRDLPGIEWTSEMDDYEAVQKVSVEKEDAQQKRDLAPTESTKIPVIDSGRGKPAQKSPEQELYDRATEAHAHVSMNPAAAAKVWRDGMVSAAEELRESLEKIAKSDRQKEAIAAQINLFKQGYVEHARPILSAISRQVSSMVAGKSQFSKNHDKRNSGAQSAEQKANDAFTKWQKEAKEYARQAILNARTPEEVEADEQAAANETKRVATAKHNKELSIVKQWMALKPGDMVDVGGNGKVAIAKKNRKSIETEGGAKWTITELLGIESKKADELMAEAEAEIVSDTPFTLASHDSLFKRLRDGEPVTVDEVKKGFDSLVEGEEAIKAELQAMKKDDLLKRMGRFSAGRYKNEKKDVIVSAIYRGMVTDFAYLDGSNSLSYGMRDKVSDVVQKRVEKLTEEGLKKYAEAVAKERDDYKARMEGYVKAIKNPETWEEFQKYRELGYKIEDLPPEKLKLYDELKAEHNREQKAREAERKATVSQVETDVEMTLKETTHTKKGTPLFVVQLSDRVERDIYNELNAAAKKLGGYYSSFRGAGAVPGFQFKTREDAEKFMAIREGDVSRADKLEEKAEERQGKKVSKLRAVAESLKERAEEQLSRDRLTNTAKRARQANGAEESARSDIQLAETMLNLADAIESGEATHLDGVAAKTHVETLKGLLRSAKYAYEKAKDIPYIDSKNRTVTEDDVDFAKYPYPAQHESHIRDLATFLKDKKGAAMDAAWLSKMAKERTHDSIVSFIQPWDIERLESILAKTKRFVKDSSAKSAIENIADRMQDYNRLQRMGIPDLPSLRAALREFLKFRAGGREADKAKQLERDLVGKKVGVDFFPTPPELAGRMVEMAGVEPGMRVLEPSAGNGNIAEAIRDAGVEPDVAEISPSLREVLEAKGFAVVGQDFMDVDGEYDAIIMNPPFSDNQDIEHVRHAFDLLKPGGKLVAIMGEGAFFRGGKTENAFREWIDEQGADVEKLPEGTFTDKRLLNTTGVNARLVVVRKEGAEASKNALQAVTEAAADTPAEVVQDAVKSAREAGVSLKEQKKFLLENIDEAIKAAPKEIDWKAFNPIAKNREAAEMDYDNARERKESFLDEINSLERNIKEGKVGDTELTEKEIQEYREKLSELRPLHGEAEKAVQTAKAKLDEIKSKIRDKFMVTIEVPNDGTFDVFNTKETLAKFKEQVSKQFPSAEKPSSAKGYGNLPKPTGVKAEGLEGGAVIPTNDGVWHTNGYIAVKGEPTIKFKSIHDKIRTDMSREEGTGMMARIIPKADTGNPVTSVEFAAGRGVMTDNADFRATSDAPIKTAKDEVGYVRLTTESGFSAILSQKLYVYAKQAYPNAEIRVKNENEPVIFVESGDVVAVVMPIRNGGKDGYFEEKGGVTRSVSPADMEAIANNGLQDEVVSDAPVSSVGALSKEDVADILRKESAKLVEVKGVFSDDLRRIAKAFGQEIAFYSPLRDRERGGDKEEAGRGMGSAGHTNGFIVNDAGARVVFLNTDSKSPLGFVLAHELTHRLQYEREEDYRLLAERLANAADMDRLFDYLDRQQTINPADSGTQLYGEFVANLVGERFLSKGFWTEFARKEPSLFRKIADVALRIIESIKKLFLESPTASSVVTDMAKAEKYIADAMRGFAGEVERQGNATKPRFSYRITPATKGTEKTAIEKAIAPLLKKWKNAPEVKVVQSESELPENLKAEMASIAAQGEIDGVFDGGVVYLIADNMPNARDAVRVLLHEAVGHYGVRGLLGKRFDTVLLDVFYVYGKDGLQDIADRYGLDLNEFEDRMIACEEKLAEIAESGEKPGLVKRAIAAIREWLRSIGVNVFLTDNDIRSMIAKAAELVERGRGKGNIRNLKRGKDGYFELNVSGKIESTPQIQKAFQAFSAKNGGINLHEVSVTGESADILKRIAEKFNRKAVFFDTDTPELLNAEGFVLPVDTERIYISVRAARPHLFTIGQITEALGKADTDIAITVPRFSRSDRVVNPDSGLGDVVIAPAESSKEIGGILGQEEGNLKQVSVKGGNSDALRSIAKLFGKEVVFFADMAALESESETPLLHPEGVERNTYPGTDETGKGVQAGILEGKEAAAGIVNPRHPQYIFLNIGSSNHLFFILGHELSHTLRIDDKQLWTQMAKELQPLVRRWGEYRGRLNQHHLPEDEQAEELFGDIIGHNFTDEQFWADMAKESPSLFKRIAARAIEIVNKIFDVTFDTDISPFVSDMRQARAIVARALSKYAHGAEAGLYDKYASEFDGRQNRHSRFHIRQSLSTAAALDHLRTIDPKAALGGLKDLINPLDWSRYAKGVSEMTPQAVQEAVGYFFANPVFQAERDPDKQPFVKSGLEREQNKVDLLLKMFGWDGSKEKSPKLMERLTRTFTRWQNDDITTSWGRIMDSFQKLSAKDRKGVDWLLYRGDVDGVSYKTYDMVKDSAKVAKRLPSEAAFNAYRQIRDHIDTVVAQVIEDQTRKFMFEAGLPEEEIEKHITDYRNQLNRMPGWMPRSHGEGDWQVNVYHHITRLKWQVSGGRAFLPFFPSQAVADEIEKLATAHGLKYRHLRNGRQLVEVDEKAREKLKKEIRKLKESLEKGAGEMYASTREEIEAKIANAERKLVLAESPPSEQIRRFTNASTGIIGDISTRNALTKRELEAQLEQAREDGESAAEIKRLENEIEKVGDGRIKVKVYMRLQRTERQAGKHVKEVQATLKKHMPENYLDGEYYEVSSKFSDTISEGMYGDMKNDFAMEQAQLKAIEWAANHGEISKEKAASLRHGILQTTAEVLMARGAGSHRIRRANYLIEGYDAENVTDQYHDYMTGTAGMLSKAMYAKEQFENFRYADPKVKRWAERYIKDNLRNMGFADSVSGNLRSLAAFMYLGFKVSSMLINATQVYTLGIAELGRHTKRSALKLITTAQKDIVTDNLTAEERELFHSSIWKIQEQETAVNEMSGSREGITGKVSRFMHILTDKALMPFQEVEMLNRKTMILSAYRAFRADGMRKQDAIDRALEVNRAVNFEMSRANLPGFARNPAGRTIYALQSFAWNNWNWVYNRLTSGEKRDMVALLKYAGTLAVIGGAAALPGGDELDKLLRRLTGRSIKMDLQKWTREHAHRYGTAGDMLNDFVWHGTGSAVGVNISNALRLQVPFVSPWLQGETLPESSMGVFAGLWQKGANAGRAFSKGDAYRGAESLAPEFVSGPMRAYRQYAEGTTTMGGKPVFDENGKPIRYSLSDVALRTAGFQPLKQSERTEAAQQGKILSQHWNEERQDLIDAYRIADKDGRRGVMQKIMRFNAGLRESQAAGLVLPIKLSTLQRAVQSKPDRKKAGWLRKTIG